MISEFGQLMLYVKDPRSCAQFWTEIMGFEEVSTNDMNGQLFSVELKRDQTSEVSLVVMDVSVVKKFSPEISTTTPSILFSTKDAKEMRNQLISQSVNVGDLVEINNQLTFNFSDVEGNYFAVREVK